MTGEKLPQGNVDFGELLKDGHLLCKYVQPIKILITHQKFVIFLPNRRVMNKIQPGSVKKLLTKGEYALRENVGNFIQACRRYGLREDDCFATSDLCDRADLSQVASTLFSLAEMVKNILHKN